MQKISSAQYKLKVPEFDICFLHFKEPVENTLLFKYHKSKAKPSVLLYSGYNGDTPVEKLKFSNEVSPIDNSLNSPDIRNAKINVQLSRISNSLPLVKKPLNCTNEELKVSEALKLDYGYKGMSGGPIYTEDFHVIGINSFGCNDGKKKDSVYGIYLFERAVRRKIVKIIKFIKSEFKVYDDYLYK